MFRIAMALPAFAVAAALSGPALAKTEKGFVADAIKGDTSEIVLGQLALSKSGSSDVKAFAQTLVADHTQGKAQASAVAEKLGLAPPTGVSPEAQQELDKLQKLSGKPFDEEFVRYMVGDHEKDVAEFRQESQSGRGPAQDLAAQSLPTLEKHLQIAKSLQGKV